MPRSVTEYRCLIISPSDLEEERDAVTDVIIRWNTSVGSNFAVRVEPVRWETHSHPDLSEPPQAVLNRQLVDQCDLGVAVFWTRLGSPTGQFPSGSIEEIERLLARGKRVLMYRSSHPVTPERVDISQLKDLRAALAAYEKRGLIGQYSDVGELREKLSGSLLNVIGPIAPNGIVATAPRPDIRVRVAFVIAHPPELEQPTYALKVAVANHSPAPLFLSSIALKLDTGNNLLPLRDAFTNQPNAGGRIEAGDSLDFHIYTRVILDGAPDPSRIVCAEAFDKIGRSYSSEPEEMRKVLGTLLKRATKVGGDSNRVAQ